jgi:hypothetical protein
MYKPQGFPFRSYDNNADVDEEENFVAILACIDDGTTSILDEHPPPAKARNGHVLKKTTVRHGYADPEQRVQRWVRVVHHHRSSSSTLVDDCQH